MHGKVLANGQPAACARVVFYPTSQETGGENCRRQQEKPMPLANTGCSRLFPMMGPRSAITEQRLFGSNHRRQMPKGFSTSAIALRAATPTQRPRT